MRISDRSSDVCSSDLMTISMDLAPQLRASGATSLATVAASTAQTEGREPHYMVVLYTVWYNFLRMHKTLKMTPAMAAGVTATLRSMEDGVAVIDTSAPKPGPHGTYRKRSGGCDKVAWKRQSGGKGK